MPPGGETSRYSGRFGKNILLYGSHEWLPYSKDEVRLKSSNNNLSFSLPPIIPTTQIPPQSITLRGSYYLTGNQTPE